GESATRFAGTRPPAAPLLLAPSRDRHQKEPLNMLLSQTLAFVGAILYGSFFEWFVHKHFMHSTKWLKEPFERHAILHHGMQRSLRSFFARPSDNPQYMLIEASFFPFVWLLHVPLYLGIDH